MYKATANLLIVCFLCWMTGCSSTNTVSEDLVPTDYVNPFIGASTSVGAAGVYHGLGKTFPGATTPYGMVQVSPNSVFYFYGVNILRNIKEILPNSSNGHKVVAFLHYVLSVEFIKNIPYLTNYLQKGDAK